MKCAPFEDDAEDFACLSVDFGNCKVEAIKLKLEMTEERLTRQEEHSGNGPTGDLKYHGFNNEGVSSNEKGKKKPSPTVGHHL